MVYIYCKEGHGIDNQIGVAGYRFLRAIASNVYCQPEYEDEDISESKWEGDNSSESQDEDQWESEHEEQRDCKNEDRQEYNSDQDEQ